eukprot:COSAG03_NODE_464_length_7697_cov_3.596999_1_plen_37_part_10
MRQRYERPGLILVQNLVQLLRKLHLVHANEPSACERV